VLKLIQSISFEVSADQSRALGSLSSYFEDENEAASKLRTTKKCFARYFPKLEEEGSTWSLGFNSCKENATNKRKSLLTDVGDAQKRIREAALNIRSFIDQCIAISDALDFFNCFARMSKQHSTAVYSISYHALEESMILNQQLSSIQVEHYLCTNRTEDKYVTGTNKIFRALDHCLQQNGTH
ncbi:hypothetical protein KR018_011327, partial [Drosophila ironensis]